MEGLAATELYHSYKEVAALDGVSLTVESGECVALVGESGSGKTTLLRCFNRMVEPDRGLVRINGSPVSEINPVMLRRRIGYVPQDGGLLPHWSVERNTSLLPWLNNDDAATDSALSALHRVGLGSDGLGQRWPNELSGGQRQRVAIARAIAASPDTILLDEPFGALDAITRSELHQLFLTLRHELSFTALLVTHDLREAFLLSDRVAVMRSGRIEQLDSPQVLCNTPSSDYVAQLIDRAGVQ